MKFWKDLKKWYDNLSSDKQESIVSFFNYLLNGLPVSLFVYIVMSLWLSQSLIRYFCTYVAVTIFLFYFEYYWVFLRRQND